MITWKKSYSLILIFFVLVGSIYFLARNSYPVGFFNDDAFFIIGARSLLQGRLVELNQPGFPALVNYMPGYPLLIIPFVWLFPNSFTPLQIFSIFQVLLGLVLSWITFRNKFSRSVLLWAGLITILNPLFLTLSSTILSDIPYFLFSVIVLEFAKLIWRKSDVLLWIALTLLCSFSFYLRPIGLIFPMALMGCLIFEKRFKEVGVILIGTIVTVVPYFLYSQSANGKIPYYFGDLIRNFKSSQNSLYSGFWMLENFIFYLKQFSLVYLFRWPSWFEWGVMKMALVIISMGALLVGGVDLIKKNNGWGRFIFLWLCFNCLVLIAWKNQSGRYLFPVLPVLLLLFFDGIEKIQKKINLKFLLPLFGILSLITFIAPFSKITDVMTGKKENPLSLPESAYQWVRENTSGTDILAAEMDGTFFLKTGRQTKQFPYAFDKQGFLLWVEQFRIKYVVLMSSDLILKSTQERKGLESSSVASSENIFNDTSRFKRCFEDSKFNLVIFQVL